MKGNNGNLLFKLTFVAFWTSVALYLIPFFSQFLNLQRINTNSDYFLNTVYRSILFSVAASLAIVILSYTFSLLINEIELDSKLGKILSISIIPIILGNVTTAYIFKSILADTQIFSNVLTSGPFTNYFLLTIIQLWQFGFLFTYVFWLNHKAVNKNKIEFVISSQLGFFNRIKDIHLPNSKNLIILFTLIAFIYNFYEEAKAYYIFKFSQGTNTELINHWLFRNYQSELIINPTQAGIRLLGYSLIVFLVVSFTAFVLLTVIKVIIDKLTRIKPLNTQFEHSKRISGKAVILFFVFSLLFPIFYSLTKTTPTLEFELSVLSYPLALTFLTSLITTFLAILISIAFRQIFSKTFSSFNTKSSISITLIFSLLLIPPIVVMLCGYKWNANLLNSVINTTTLVWIIGHVILLLPVLISFLIVTHFSISNNELEYLRVYSQSTSETLRLNYIKRFQGQYLLTFMFSVGIIWNEDIINKMLSDSIPSFANGMEMMISGKSADFSKASGYLLVSLFISIICVALWNFLFNKKLNIQK